MRTWLTAKFGRVRVSTIVLMVAFVALLWIYHNFEPHSASTQAPTTAVVPPGFVPDPNYTWVPRTSLREPQEPLTTTETTTTTTTTSPTETTTTTTSPGETTSPTSPTGSTPTTTVIPGIPGIPGLQTTTQTPTLTPATAPAPGSGPALTTPIPPR